MQYNYQVINQMRINSISKRHISLKDAARHVSTGALCIIMSVASVSANENDSLYIATQLDSTSVPANLSFGQPQEIAPTDSAIIKYPYSRLLECTHVGVPLFVGGIIEMEHNKKFRELRNSFMPRFHSEIDNYTQYLPAAVMFGLKAFGVESRSKWGEMMTADAFSVAIMAAGVNSLK